jgi:hypothetical protein
MSRWKSFQKVSLLALALSLGFAFAPSLAPRLHAQEDEEEDPAQALTPEQKKELQALGRAQQKADEAIQSEDYEAGVKVFKKLCDKLDQSKLPEKMIWQAKYLAHYNYACCLSRTGAKEDAVKEFGRSVELGFFDWKHIGKDADLDALRELDSFKKAVEDGKKLEVEKLASQVKSGKPAIQLFAFDGEDKDGNKKSLASYKGKVLVLGIANAAREEQLVDEASHLQKASDELKEKGLEVALLLFGTEKDGLDDLAKRLKTKFELLVGGDPSESLKAALRSGQTVFIVDRAGKVRATAPSVHQAEAIIAAAKPLLDEAAGEEKKEDGKKDDEKKPEKKKEEKKDDF